MKFVDAFIMTAELPNLLHICSCVQAPALHAAVTSANFTGVKEESDWSDLYVTQFYFQDPKQHESPCFLVWFSVSGNHYVRDLLTRKKHHPINTNATHSFFFFPNVKKQDTRLIRPERSFVVLLSQSSCYLWRGGARESNLTQDIEGHTQQ